MRRFNRLVILSIIIGVISAVTTTVQAQEYKIGVVNAVRILEQSPQARKTTALIENEFSPRNKQLIEEQKNLQTMEDRLAKDAAVMSETERRNLERDIINKRRELTRDQDEFREDLTFRRNEELGKFKPKLSMLYKLLRVIIISTW